MIRVASVLFNNGGSSSYLRVREIVNIAAVDFQKSVSISKAVPICYPTRYHISDYVSLSPLLYPQIEAIGLAFIAFKNTQAWAW